jgi:DNA-binding CsgD family transcriptional regulator
MAVDQTSSWIGAVRKRAAGLTAREVDVLQLLSHGLEYAEIGPQLGVTPRSAKEFTHRATLRLDCPDRLSATAQAAWIGVVDPLRKLGQPQRLHLRERLLALTPHELDVLLLTALYGERSGGIAAAQLVPVASLPSLRHSLMRAFEARDLIQAVAIAIAVGLIDDIALGARALSLLERRAAAALALTHGDVRMASDVVGLTEDEWELIVGGAMRKLATASHVGLLVRMMVAG